MSENNELEKEVKPEASEQESLVIAIVNKGMTDLVMSAARKAGARGGTIAPARGTADQEMASFYGIPLTPEKEMVFVVVLSSERDKVMKQIYDEAGLRTNGNGIIFSMPITDSVGINFGQNKNQAK